MRKNFQKFIATLPPVSEAFALAYLEYLSTKNGAEISGLFGGDALGKIKKIFPEKFMDEDFRAKNIGQSSQLPRLDYLHCSIEGKKQLEEYRRKRAAELAGREKRRLCGVKISNDYGRNWKLFCLCDECVAETEPPKMLKNEGAAGAIKCDWCGALNEK